MSYCALDEAFMGPPEGVLPVKRHKKYRPKETSVPTALPDVPGPDTSVKHDDILTASPAAPVNRLQSSQNPDSFFPVPGDDSDSWEKAFMMESDFTKTMPRPDGSVPVAGKSTLWRNIQEVPKEVSRESRESQPSMADVHRRLDMLTKQLETLGAPTPGQSTAELFLFVAIGLIMLLAIDTLLRFATSFTVAKQSGGSYSRGPGGRFMSMRRFK